MSKSKKKRDSTANFGESLGKTILGWKGKYQEYNDKFFSSLDDLTLDEAIDKYRGYQKILWYCPLIIWAVEIILFFFSLQSLDWQILTLLIEVALIANLIGINNVNWFLINLLTRQPKKYKEERLADINKVIKTRNLQRSLTVGGVLNTIAIFTIIPYYEFLRNNPDLQGWNYHMTDQVNGSDIVIKLLIASLPIFITYNFYQIERKTASDYKEQLEAGIQAKQYHNTRLRNMLSGKTQEQRKEENHLPIMIIGTSQETGDIVYQSVTTRRQNSIYMGAVGSGKSKTIFSYQMYQDLQKVVWWIRDYPKISKMDGFMTKKGNIATQYLNGMALIDPTNDQTADIYELARAMGIPDDYIVWFDPSNPHTKGLNLMRGPAEKVAEDLTNVIAGVQESSQDFFHEAGRNHLKNYVYLLKITSVLSKHIPTLADLIDMYNSPYVVRKRMKQLDAYLQVLESKLEQEKQAYDQDPNNEDKRTIYFEIRDKYQIAQSTASWFKLNIIPNRKGNSVVKRSDPELQSLDDKDPDKWEYIDAQAEFVRGLANTLDDISKNIGLRRVLFRDSGDFNLDDAMYRGKILLCNTDEEHVGSSLAKTLGQIYLGSLEASTLRRKNNAVPMFPLYMDEFAAYADEFFLQFSAESRKFSCPCIVATQSPGQLSKAFGQDGLKTFFDDFLTVGTFGNMSPDSAEFFERFFGSKKQSVRSTNEQQVGLMQGMSGNRRMVTTRQEDVPNITKDELMAMDKYTVAVRTPNPEGVHGSQLFNTIRTDYVDVNTVADKPGNFDINDPKDREGFEAIMGAKGISNPDLDDVDAEIQQEYFNGDFDYEETQTGAKVVYKSNAPHHDPNEIFGKKGKKKSSDNGTIDMPNLPDNPEDSTSNVDFKSASKNMNDEADDGVDLSTGNNALMNDLLGNGAIDGDDNDKGQDKGKGDDNDDMLNLPPNPDPDKPSSNNGGASPKPQSSTPDSDGTNKADTSSDDDSINIYDLVGDSSSDSTGSNSMFGNDDDASSGSNGLFGSSTEDKPQASAPKQEKPIPKVQLATNPMKNEQTLKDVVNVAGKHGGNERIKRSFHESPFLPNEFKQKVEEQNRRAEEQANAQQAQATSPSTPPSTQPTVATSPKMQATTAPVQSSSTITLPPKKDTSKSIPVPSQETESDDGMLKIDPKTGRIKEDTSHHDAMRKRYLERNKENTTDEAMEGLVSDAEAEVGILVGRSDLNPAQKLAEVKRIQVNYKQMFNSINPEGMPSDLKRFFSRQATALKKEKDAGFTLNGKNTSEKLNEIKNDKELMKSLRNMFNQQEDPNLEVDLNNNKFIRNAERDDDFNQKDPFYTQPGMRDDE